MKFSRPVCSRPVRSRVRRICIESLESRRLLAADLFAAEFETDPRLIEMFYGPRRPDQPVPPIQAIAPLIDGTSEEAPPILEGLPASVADDNLPSGAAPFALDQTFSLNSRPDSNFTIYLDFDGHVTTGTSWNSAYGFSEIIHPNYWGGTGGDFSNNRLELIQEIWQVVAEDFAPFDVNITTEEPVDLDDLRYNGPGDTRWGSRVVMTKDTFADCSCGGHAYLGSFDDLQDEPAFVYNGGLNAGSETVSHEVGHQLGLHHDGNGSNTYYRGHGSGDTSWGPIMGAPFSKLTTQWSHGDYYNATLPGEDDLAIITGSSNFPFISDDHADIRTDASTVLERNTTSIEAFGIIETNDDIDWLRFQTGGGDVTLDVDVTGYKPNLDVWAGLFDSTGQFITDANPQSQLSASFGTLTLDAGEYFVKLDGGPRDSTYDPVLDQLIEPSPAPYTVSGPLGYSDYGSLGQYRLHGTIVDPGSPTVAISAGSSTYTEGQSATIELSTSDGGSGSFTVEIMPTRQSRPSHPAPDSTENSDFAIATTQTVTVTNGSGILTIPLVDDYEVENTETFRVMISDPGAYAVSNRYVDIDVRESQSQFSIFATDTSTREGDPGSEQSHQFTILREGRTDIAQTIAWQRVLSGSTPTQESAQEDDFASPASGTIVFGVDQTTAVLEIDLHGDLVDEADETYSIELEVAAGENYLIPYQTSSASGIIRNDESTIDFTSSAKFRIRQVEFSGGNLDHFAIDNFAIPGTSVGDDFDPNIDQQVWDSIVSASESAIFPDTDGNALVFSGTVERSATTVPASPPLGSSLDFDIIFASYNAPGLNATENGEDAILEYTLDGTEWIQIQRFDEAEFASWTPMSIPLPAAATFLPTAFTEGDEGTTTASMEITRTGFLDKPMNVDWIISPDGGSDPAEIDDFGGTFPSDTVQFAAGESTAMVHFEIAGDSSIEPDETFNLTVTGSTGGPILNPSLRGSITNDDFAGPEINVLGINGAAILAGDSTASIEDGTDYGLITVDGEPEVQSFVIENAGITDLHLNGISIEGADAVAYAVENLSTNTVAPGETATLSIAFNPTNGGRHHATIVIDNDDPSESLYQFAVSGLATDLAVEEIIINDGSIARSQIESIRVRFNQLVADEPLNRAFQVRLVSNQTQFFPYPTVDSDEVDGKTEVELTFPSVGGSGTGELAWVDGFYELRIQANSVISITEESYPMPANVYFGTEAGEIDNTDHFFRLFGDVNGDRDVNKIDLDKFVATLGFEQSDLGFNPQFDFDGDGDVDTTDYVQIRRRLF
ncbi:choice-of-anchor D domain-containing protein [Roseiconus lacunae]|uniref:Choice-of-anchor D domain-containing protein n=1 Tax=Roseiconus lacunae TaxID=2605694 RepID=A0ABT7PGB7_9BACT|nr:choice-of-anchor D domain-containing protein [Roseiconus lacunae]MDM4015527.1 choice-of-anchor D domain-containing protein [Roseiconus lacunae]